MCEKELELTALGPEFCSVLSQDSPFLGFRVWGKRGTKERVKSNMGVGFRVSQVQHWWFSGKGF